MSLPEFYVAMDQNTERPSELPTDARLGQNLWMAKEQIDPRWPRLMGLAVHELRTPITVAAGYIRMVTREKVGPITDQQRKVLEEAEKACAKLSALVGEMADLAALEEGRATVNKARMDLSRTLEEAADSLTPLPDRDIAIEIQGADHPSPITGDVTRLRSAFASIIGALRRELVESNRLIVRLGRRTESCTICIEQVVSADTSTLDVFDEWRGGSGLALAIARRIIDQHGGRLLGLAGGEKASAVVVLPC
jgi:signal transduction histidine kinase